jgi:hypothetical protein
LALPFRLRCFESIPVARGAILAIVEPPWQQGSPATVTVSRQMFADILMLICPAAGATRPSMKALWVERRAPWWERCVLMTANDQVPAPEGKVTNGFYCPGQLEGD